MNSRETDSSVPLIQESNLKIVTQIHAIRHFIEKMDIEMIDSFLDNDITYQEMEKYLFISKLQQAFKTFAGFGDTHLLSVEGSCNACDSTKSGFTFFGNNSHNYMSIIFDTKNKKIIDLYECSDFKNRQGKLYLKNRIHIDDNDVRF